MNPVILIPARLASTRLPRKPLVDIAGVPMIVHVWRRAVEADIGPVWVACDDNGVWQAIDAQGGKVIMTQAGHPSGSDRIYEALTSIDPGKNYDVIVNLQGDVPLIEPNVLHALLRLHTGGGADITTLAAKITRTEERTDPSVVKAVLSEFRGSKKRIARARDFSRRPEPADDGCLYHHIGVYGYKRSALETFVHLPQSAREKQEKLEQLRALDAGMRIEVAIVDTVPLGVDTPEHLERARKIVAGGW